MRLLRGPGRPADRELSRQLPPAGAEGEPGRGAAVSRGPACQERAENLGCTFRAPCVIPYFCLFWIYARQGWQAPPPRASNITHAGPARRRSPILAHSTDESATAGCPGGPPGSGAAPGPAPSGEETPCFPARQGRKAGASFARSFCAQPYIDQNLTNQKQGVSYG